MKKISNLKLGLTALFICASTAAMADDSFAWTGYMRTGTALSSDKSTDVESVNEKAIGRYGNEFNTWLTSTMHKTMTSPNGAKAELTLDGNVFINDAETSMAAAGSGAFYVGEVSIKFSGLDFLPKDATLKFGEMAINQDIHALDYKFKNTTGTGVIYKDGNNQFALMVDEGRGTKAIDVEHNIGNIETKITASQKIANSDSSVSAMVAYNQNKLLGVLPGTTKYVAQFGIGVGTTNGDVSLSRNCVDNKDGSAYRFIIDGHGTAGKLIINPVLWAEGVNYGDNTLKNYTSISAGARVTQPITNNLQMMYEGFVNAKENNQGTATADGVQYKIAAGPAVQLEMGEWVRPVARITATYIGGDKEITGLSKDSELRLGSQFELWF